MERIEENLLELQKEIEEGLYRYRSDPFYTHYNYLSDNTKKLLSPNIGSLPLIRAYYISNVILFMSALFHLL
jgi:hypothetical protein